MKTVRGQTLGFLALSLAVVCLAWWGCGKKSEPEGSSTTSTPVTTSNPAPTSAGDTTGGGEISLAVGERVFKTNCETCHGPQGRGDGPAGQALNPKPRDFHDKSYMSKLSDQQWHDTIKNGKPGTAMPAWGTILKENEIRSVMIKERSFSQ